MGEMPDIIGKHYFIGNVSQSDGDQKPLCVCGAIDCADAHEAVRWCAQVNEPARIRAQAPSWRRRLSWEEAGQQ